MKRILIGVAVSLVTSVLTCSFAHAQATAQISGAVRDQTGAVLPGVEIIATQTDTGINRSTLTNETGSYVLPNLALGPYRLEVGLPGFRTFVQTGIVLQVNSSPVINPVLEIGQVSEQVEVEANAALVETRNSGIGQVIENERILELPLNGRNVTDLITLAGAAVDTGVTPDRSFGGSSFISVAGGLNYAVEYNLDGANHINFITGAGMPMPFPDALQEFKVETTGLTAQRRDAASVGGVTKSGTNALHGVLFEFVRNDLFNARNYFATSNSTLKRNQFGGTLGGAIVKNKLFFFGGYQGTTLREDPADLQAFVPTPAMMAGDWTAFTSPGCNAGRQMTLRAPFTNNRIDPALYSKAAVNIVSRLNQKPDNRCGLVTFGTRNVRNDGQAIGKIDFQWNNKHSLFGRYMATPNKDPDPFTFTPNNFLNANAIGYDSLAQSLALGDTYLVGPNMVQSLRFAANRISVHRINSAFFSACDMGINISCAYTPKRMQLTVTNGFTLGGSGSPDDDRYKTNSYQLNDDVSLVRGTHQTSFGANFMHSMHYSFANFVSVGQLVVNGQETGLGLGDLMLGKLTSLFMGGPTLVHLSQPSVALYGSDAWKVTPKLTMTYGVRWEPYLPQDMKNGIAFNFDNERFRQGIKSGVYKNAPAGFYYPGDSGFPGRSGVNTRWMQLGPRIGLAWDVTGNGRTSLRASYSLGYDFANAQWRQDTSGAAPWAGRTLVSSPPGGLENPWQGFPGGDPFPIKLGSDTVFQPYGNFSSTPYDLKTPSTSSWNLSIQKQIGAGWLVSSSYIGTHTIHVWASKAINPSTYFPGGPCVLNGVTYNPCSSTSNVDQRRRFSLERPQDGRLMGAVAEFESGGNLSYEGLLLSVQHRAARGLTFNGNYTWSHCIGNYEPGGNGGPSATQTYTDPNNRNLDRGNCGSDRRNVFNVTAVADAPQFSNRTMHILVTGWKVSGIYRVSSGSPLTILAGTDRALTGIGSQRGNQILENPYTGTSGPLVNYLNRAAFDIPALGTMGRMGRNNIQGPPTWSFDAAISRVFAFREAQRLELRAEAYNVTNSFRPGNPSASLNSSTFGQIRTSSPPRIMQFALKFIF